MNHPLGFFEFPGGVVEYTGEEQARMLEEEQKGKKDEKKDEISKKKESDLFFLDKAYNVWYSTHTATAAAGTVRRKFC